MTLNGRYVLQHKCQHSMAPGYLAKLCRPVSNIDGQRHLRSAGCGQLDVPPVRLSTYGGRAFCHAVTSAWNAVPDFLKQESPAVADKPARRLRKVCTVYVRTVGW